MKKSFLYFLLAVMVASLAAKRIEFAESSHGYSISRNTDEALELSFKVDGLEAKEDLITEDGVYSYLSLEGGDYTLTVGAPMLPNFKHLIEIPADAKASIEVLSYDVKEYDLYDFGITSKLFPAQPSYPKNIDPAKIKFQKDNALYSSDQFIGEKLATITKDGVMRGVGVAQITINPIKYNPVQNKIQVYNNLKVKVNYNSSNPFLAKEIKSKSYSPFFKDAYKSLINYKASDTRSIISYPVTYLIVANDKLEGNEDLERFISWKTEKGFKVLTHYVDGATEVDDIKTWIEEQYENTEPKPSFVLVVGDMNGEYTVKTRLSNIASSKASDLSYGVVGTVSDNNHVPSMYVGRFSVRSLTDLKAQVDKTIWYEKEMFTTGADISYLENCMVVAGDDAGHQASHGNPHVRYAMAHYFNNEDYVYPKYDEVPVLTGIPYLDGAPNQDAEIVQHVADGVAYYNYTAHGNVTLFADPQFTISNINSLGNEGKYGFIIGNCCLTGTFTEAECFGEAWLNAENQGSIGFLGAAQSTYWDEDLAMGVGRPDTGNTTPPYSPEDPGMVDAIMNMDNLTTGGLKHAGLLAVDRMNSSRIMYYYNAYHIFGDPSIMLYMGVPTEMQVSHAPTVIPGGYSYNVEAVPGAYVALSDDEGMLHGAGVCDESGSAVISLTEPFTSGPAHLIVTAQFKKPHFEEIPVVPLDGPYLIVNNYEIHNPENNKICELDLELKNIGTENSENITLTASSESEYVAFTDNSENYNNIGSGDSSMVNSAIAFNIAAETPDQTKIKINLAMNDSYKQSYSKKINFKVNAPNVSLLEVLANGEGNVAAGETREYTFRIQNTGHLSVENLSANLQQISGHDIQIESATQDLGVLDAGGAIVEFVTNITFGSDIAIGHVASFRLYLSGDNGFSKTESYDVIVGNNVIISESFEGTFPPEGWTSEKWFKSATLAHDGDYAAGTKYSHEGEALLITPEFDVPTSGMTLSFYWCDKDFYSTGKVAGHDTTFCEISSDNGASWDLKTFLSSVGAEGSFHKDSVDLSEYVGKTIKIRWRDVNDDSYNAYGTGLDLVRISYPALGVDEEVEALPSEATLYQNYPNPFNPVTEIKFYNPNNQHVNLAVYNTLGEKVVELVNGNKVAGFHTALFDARNLASGTYYYKLKINNSVISKKMVLLK